ncbi:MAG: TrmH family RNA methyltransferase [Gelidibacter sp.]|nr:TrmH family RNA methyltransferase [Gelidibacter sp.]
MQLSHNTSPIKKQKFFFFFFCDHVTNAPNLGSLFRTADAFAVEKLVFCGANISLGRKMTKTSRATEKYVNYEMHSDISEVIKSLKTNGYHIVALEITTNSQSIQNHTFNKSQAIALIIGDENFGISEAVLQQADTVLHIDMYGQNSSMNVVQATTVALYEITKQLSL